jgi:hypothetical protein
MCYGAPWKRRRPSSSREVQSIIDAVIFMTAKGNYRLGNRQVRSQEGILDIPVRPQSLYKNNGGEVMTGA